MILATKFVHSAKYIPFEIIYLVVINNPFVIKKFDHLFENTAIKDERFCPGTAVAAKGCNWKTKDWML